MYTKPLNHQQYAQVHIFNREIKHFNKAIRKNKHLVIVLYTYVSPAELFQSYYYIICKYEWQPSI